MLELTSAAHALMPRLCLLSVALCLVAVELAAQQAAGPRFDATVTAPAYPASGARHPRVRIDEGHFNRWCTRVLIEGAATPGSRSYYATTDTSSLPTRRGSRRNGPSGSRQRQLALNVMHWL